MHLFGEHYSLSFYCLNGFFLSRISASSGWNQTIIFWKGGGRTQAWVVHAFVFVFVFVLFYVIVLINVNLTYFPFNSTTLFDIFFFFRSKPRHGCCIYDGDVKSKRIRNFRLVGAKIFSISNSPSDVM